MEYSGPRSSRLEKSQFDAGIDIQQKILAYLRSARPPPVAQLSLKTRLVLGMGVPFRERALAAAAGEAKSTKQYPALLLLPTLETIWDTDQDYDVLPRELVTDHLDVHLLAHLEPEVADEVLIDPGLELTHPEGGLAIGTLLGDGGGVGLTRRRTLELSGGGIGLAGHGSINGSRGARSGSVLLRESFEAVVRHGCKNQSPKVDVRI